VPVFNLSSRDRNRLRKIYPFLKRKDRNQLITDGDYFVEIGEIDYNNTDTGSHTFSTSFSNTPVITAISVESNTTPDNDGNVNAFIASVNNASITIKVSDDNFVGKVHFHAFQQGILKTKNIRDDRFRKCYNYIVKSPITETVIGGSAGIESGIMQFNNTDTATHNFTFSFAAIPVVTAIANSENEGDVNVYVHSVTDSQLIIKVSDSNYKGEVHFHAIG
jgi:hypothetical protein